MPPPDGSVYTLTLSGTNAAAARFGEGAHHSSRSALPAGNASGLSVLPHDLAGAPLKRRVRSRGVLVMLALVALMHLESGL